MKKSRKIMSVLLVVAMLFTLVSPAMAEGEKPGSITITNAVENQTYTAYRILDLESYDADSNAYAYKVNRAWAEFLTGAGKEYVKIENGYVTWDAEESDAAAFAELAQKYAKENEIDAVATKTATSTTVVFDNLDLGYYLVDTTLGVLCSLNTTKPHVDMTEKNQAPSVTKEVQEDSNVGKTNEWGATNDADINQVVNYKATITVQAGAENYKLYDNMSAGLTWAGTVNVSVGDNTVTASDSTYTVNENVEGNDGVTYDFVIEFANSYIQSLDEGDTIVITYSAILNEDAVVGLTGNPNEVKLQYGDINHPTYTPKQETITYTWDMNVLKYGDGDKTKVLAGAEFVLLNSQKDKVATIVNGKLTGWVDVPAADGEGNISWPDNTTLTTNDAGKIAIKGLDADTYRLREIKAPDGYNKLNQDTDVTVTRQVSTDGKTMTYTKVTSEINNQSGAELPETGGMGTTIFYVVGGALVLGAAVLLVTRRRMAE